MDRTMSLALKLNFRQLKELVKQCNNKQKLELVRDLEQETSAIRVKKLLKKVKTSELSFEDITREVETVRTRRYDK